jgi:hypothetical protein
LLAKFVVISDLHNRAIDQWIPVTPIEHLGEPLQVGPIHIAAIHQLRDLAVVPSLDDAIVELRLRLGVEALVSSDCTTDICRRSIST